MKNNSKETAFIMKIKKIDFLNPYKPFAKLIGFLFWPLTFFPWVKRDILPILKLVNELFVNSKVLSFLAIFYPLILVVILGRVGSAHFFITGIVSIIPLVIGLQVMPPIIISLRNSSILKRIGATDTKTSDLSIAIIFYFSIVSMISLMINAGAGYLIFGDKIYFNLFNWRDYVLSHFIGIIIAMSFGMFISSQMRKEQTALLVGLLVTLPGAFLSSQFLSPTIVNKWGIVKYISFLFPQKIISVLSYTATNDHSVFDISDVKTTDFYSIENATKTIQSLKENLENLKDTSNVPLTEEQIKFWTTYYDDWPKNLKGKFEVVSQTEILIAWILAPIEIAFFSVLASLKFRWGVR